MPHDCDPESKEVVPAAPRTLKNFGFGDLVTENAKSKAGTGKARIDAAIWAWADKKYATKHGSTITRLEIAIEKQAIEVHKPLGRMGVETITIKPVGDVFQVSKSAGGELGYKDSKEYFEPTQGATSVPEKKKPSSRSTLSL